MEALKLNEALFENKEFIEFLDSILQKKLNSYNLELLIQCERQGNTEDKTLAKVKELKTIRKDIKELKNLKRTDTPEALNTGAISNIAETRKKGADQSTIFSNMSSAGIGNMI